MPYINNFILMKRSILLINEWNDLNKNKVNNWISEGYGGLVKNVENEFLTEMVGLNEN